ncbi:hypothetical protein E2974_16125 [Paracoccus yeei]|uniref:hypothetical protein n=1 Tax=Paracoccus yeei TaxID=147645 RepID=UPI0037CD7CE5
MSAFMQEFMSTVFMPALLAMVAFAIRSVVQILKAKAGVEIDAEMSRSLHDAIERYVRSKAAPYLKDAAPDLGTNLIRDEIADGAARYIEKMNPAAVSRFGLDAGKIDALIKPHIDAVLPR